MAGAFVARLRQGGRQQAAGGGRIFLLQECVTKVSGSSQDF